MQVTTLEAIILHILYKYPYTHKHIRSVYEKYENYPIMEYYYGTMTFLMIRWFRVSVLSIIPKDVVRMIAKEFWALRTSVDKNES